ncbi:MFAP2 protein, partial [Psilopogon haemacephalus]|nr:MFAP2 protein [Psilopogon haemacephalus]
LLVQGQYSRFEGITSPEPVQYPQYDQQPEVLPGGFLCCSHTPLRTKLPPNPAPPAYQPFPPWPCQSLPSQVPFLPADCREEQYPCTRLYSVHKPCKQCLNEVCFYSLRRVYVINKEICVRTVCAHEELLRADLCRDKFSKCGVMATSGLCQTVGASCARSCGGC